MDAPLNQLFIYGTLIPGEERWVYLEDFITEITPDTTRGLLYDTGRGYPAARFDATNSIPQLIHGLRMTIAPDRIDECLELMDEVEAAERGLYHRVVIVTDDGETAWSYQYGTGLADNVAIDSGSWRQHTLGEIPETADRAAASEPVVADAAPPVELPAGSGLLSFIETRVLGSLIEKSLATPQNYPLSVNALVSACNQSSSREPVTDFTEDDIMPVLVEGKDRRLVRFVHPRSGHGVTKYRHVLDEFLEINEAKTAVLAVLMLRGPQTARELRDRTERLHDFGETGAVESCLWELAELGHVVRMGRQPGQRDERWVHLLS